MRNKYEILVGAEKFIDALKETNASVLGMSGLLTLAFDSMKETVSLIEEAGLRDKVRIMIGGGPVDGGVCKVVGADNWGADAQAAVGKLADPIDHPRCGDGDTTSADHAEVR